MVTISDIAKKAKVCYHEFIIKEYRKIHGGIKANNSINTISLLFQLYMIHKSLKHPITIFFSYDQYTKASQFLSGHGKEFLLWTLSGNPENGIDPKSNKFFAEYDIGENRKYRLVIYKNNEEYNESKIKFDMANSKSYKYKEDAKNHHGKLFITSEDKIREIICENCHQKDCINKDSINFEFGVLITETSIGECTNENMIENGIIFETGHKTGIKVRHEAKHFTIYPLNSDKNFIDTIVQNGFNIYRSYICQKEIAELFYAENLNFRKEMESKDLLMEI